MTLGENKKITLALIEEYSPTNQYLTDDEDIKNRINLIYAPNYQEIALIKKILTTKTLMENSGDNPDGYAEYSLPKDMYQLKNVICLDDDNIRIKSNYYLIGNKIYISNKNEYQHILEYYKYPTVITEKTSDTFELEVDQDAQMNLCYLVANDILKVDPSANYTAFLSEYQRKKQEWDTRRELPSVIVEEGVI